MLIPKNRLVWRSIFAVCVVGVCIGVVDGKKLKRQFIMITSLKWSQVIELVSPIGSIDTLADGMTEPMIVLPDGTEVPRTLGSQPLIPKPLPTLPMPDHPYLLDEYASGGVHADSYNSSVSPLPGPRGLAPRARVIQVMDDEIGMCTPLMRDVHHRLASVCISLGGPSQLVLFDPDNHFEILARTEIPKRRGMLDPAGGWYSRMDQQGRPIVPTPGQDIRIYEARETPQGLQWNIAEQWRLDSVLPEDVSPSDVVPDWRGNYWFISGFGHVGYLQPTTDEVQVIELGGGNETIGAALTVGPQGAFVLTSQALYGLTAETGRPTVQWRWAYGQAGSVDLSTPTLMHRGELVAFSIDGIESQSLLMVLRTDTLTDEDDRVVCRLPLFTPHRSSIKNTLVGYGLSIIAQNNWGAEFFEVKDYEPGLARIDVRGDLSGCNVVWESNIVSSQVPPRLSTGDGHVYLYSRHRNTPKDVHAWYLSAFDFETGAIASELFIGSGKAIANPMLSSDFWPGGVYVAGVRNGIVTLEDTVH